MKPNPTIIALAALTTVSSASAAGVCTGTGPVAATTVLSMMAPDMCGMIASTLNMAAQIQITSIINKIAITMCMIAILVHAYTHMIAAQRMLELFPKLMVTLIAVAFINSASPKNSGSLPYMFWNGFVETYVSSETMIYKSVMDKRGQILGQGISAMTTMLPGAIALKTAHLGAKAVNAVGRSATATAIENATAVGVRQTVKNSAGTSVITGGPGGIAGGATAAGMAGVNDGGGFSLLNAAFFFLTPFMATYAYVLYSLALAMAATLMIMPLTAAASALLGSFRPIMMNALTALSLTIGVAFAPVAFNLAVETGFMRPMASTIKTIQSKEAVIVNASKQAENFANSLPGKLGDIARDNKGAIENVIDKTEKIKQTVNSITSINVGAIFAEIGKIIMGWINSLLVMIIGLIVGGLIISSMPFMIVGMVNKIFEGGGGARGYSIPSSFKPKWGGIAMGGGGGGGGGLKRQRAGVSNRLKMEGKNSDGTPRRNSNNANRRKLGGK